MRLRQPSRSLLKLLQAQLHPQKVPPLNQRRFAAHTCVHADVHYDALGRAVATDKLSYERDGLHGAALPSRLLGVEEHCPVAALLRIVQSQLLDGRPFVENCDVFVRERRLVVLVVGVGGKVTMVPDHGVPPDARRGEAGADRLCERVCREDGDVTPGARMRWS